MFISKVLRKIAKPAFVVYLGFLFLVLVFKFPTRMVLDTFSRWKTGGGVVRMPPQLVPFKTIIFYVNHVQAITDWFFKNLFCNLVMFIPYGLLLPLIIDRKPKVFLKTLVSGMILIICIEILQYVCGLGLCDVDDLILNSLSILMGYGLYRMIKQK